MSDRRHAIVLLLSAAVLWSTGGVLVKWLAIPPWSIAGLRGAIAAAFLWLVLRRPQFTWSWVQVGGGIAGAASMLGFILATKWTTAANAIFLVYTAPAYVALLSPWMLKEPIRAGDWYTILVVFIGMACFSFERLSATGWLGNVCAMSSGLATALMVLCLRKQHAASRLETMLLSNMVVAIVALPWMWDIMPSPRDWLILLVFGVVQLGLGSMLYCRGLQHVQAIEAVLIPIIEPILNPLWVLLAVGEAPSVWALTGGGIVLGAVTVRGLLAERAPDGAEALAPGRVCS